MLILKSQLSLLIYFFMGSALVALEVGASCVKCEKSETTYVEVLIMAEKAYKDPAKLADAKKSFKKNPIIHVVQNFEQLANVYESYASSCQKITKLVLYLAGTTERIVLSDQPEGVLTPLDVHYDQRRLLFLGLEHCSFRNDAKINGALAIEVLGLKVVFSKKSNFLLSDLGGYTFLTAFIGYHKTLLDQKDEWDSPNPIETKELDDLTTSLIDHYSNCGVKVEVETWQRFENQYCPQANKSIASSEKATLDPALIAKAHCTYYRSVNSEEPGFAGQKIFNNLYIKIRSLKYDITENHPVFGYDYRKRVLNILDMRSFILKHLNTLHIYTRREFVDGVFNSKITETLTCPVQPPIITNLVPSTAKVIKEGEKNEKILPDTLKNSKNKSKTPPLATPFK